MTAALYEARLALKEGEVPVGAVVVKDGEIIARAHNLRESDKDATAHAEMVAIRRACAYLGDWRLDGCDIYVTLEPCAMCSGAIRQARLRRLFFGAYDKSYGCVVSAAQYLDKPKGLSVPEYYCGIMEDECSKLLDDFFKDARNKDE